MIIVLLLVCIVGNCCCETSSYVGIIGGHKVNINSVPFMVSIRLNGTHWCGGSIISDRFVLTAAHCIDPYRNHTFKVKAGTGKINKNGDLYDIEKLIVHQKYSSKTYNFDVCLIKLSKSLTFGLRVAPVNLADYNVKLPKGTMLNVTGWGSNGRKPYSDRLLQVTVPTVPKNLCQEMYKPYNFSLTHQMICAGREGMDSCQGDSGGPLTKGNVQVGVTSKVIGCGVVPGVYVRVSTVLPWIQKTMARNIH